MQQLPTFNYGILDHQYKILKQIDEGSFGKVYLVLTQKGKLYAAKIFNLPPNEFSPSYLSPFKKEINIISSLNHPNIIKYYSSGVGPIIINGQNSIDEKQYFIMEYANKGELYQYTKKLQKGFLEKYVKLLCWDIFNTVNFCHKKGIYNGDLKVENIVFDEKYNIKIIDFGASENIPINDEISKTLKAKIITRQYAAPEVLNNKKFNGIKADIFSLGVIMFVLLTGKHQFLDTNDINYKNVKNKHNEKYIKLIGKYYENFKNSSDEFKKLYFKMIHENPQKRPNLDDILQKDEWFKEISDLNEKGELENLRNELRVELENRRKRINEDGGIMSFSEIMV